MRAKIGLNSQGPGVFKNEEKKFHFSGPLRHGAGAHSEGFQKIFRKFSENFEVFEKPRKFFEENRGKFARGSSIVHFCREKGPQKRPFFAAEKLQKSAKKSQSRPRARGKAIFCLRAKMAIF